VIAEKLIQRQMQLFGRVKYEIFSDWEEIWCNYRIQIICRDPFVEDLDEILAYQIATIAQLKKDQFEELGIIILEKKDQ